MIKIVLPALLALASLTPLWATLSVSSQASCSAHSNGATGVNDCSVSGEPSLIIPYSRAHTNGDGVFLQTETFGIDSLFLFGFAEAEAFIGGDYNEQTGEIRYHSAWARGTTTVMYEVASGGPVRPGIAVMSLIDRGSFSAGPPDGRLGSGYFRGDFTLRGPDFSSGPGRFNVTLGIGLTGALTVSAEGTAGISPGFATSWYEGRLELFEADGMTPVSVMPVMAADPVPEPGTILLSSAALGMGLAAIRLRRKLQ